MDRRLLGRAAADVASVCRQATPPTAGHWLASLLVHAPLCVRDGTLVHADRVWARTGGRFRLPGGPDIWLPPAYTAGAREMYCRNVYLRAGLTMPTADWVVDLGANAGLFSVWAALAGAQVVAVEAQQGFAADIRRLAEHNGVGDRVHIETSMASGKSMSGSGVGVLANDARWAAASHATSDRPRDISVPDIMAQYQMDRIGLLKCDIEGGEYAVFGDHDLSWLRQVEQIAMEIHMDFGDSAILIAELRSHGYTVRLTDNDGHAVDAHSGALAYAYCVRTGA